jgi:hypothetical protein
MGKRRRSRGFFTIADLNVKLLLTVIVVSGAEK